MYKKIVLVCLLFPLMSVTQAKQLLDKVVAIVNNGVITSSQMEKQVDLSKKQLLAQKVQIPAESIIRKQVLQHLIEVDLQLQIAKEHQLIIKDTELNEAIEQIATTHQVTLAQLREEITREGLNWNEYRETIRKEMILAQLQQNVVGKDVVITNEQVEQYLKTEGGIINRAVLTYHLQNIVIPLNDKPTSEQVKKAKIIAESLLLRIKRGTDFSRLVIETSGIEGDDLGERHLEQLPELFAKEVVHMEVGQVVGPLRAGNGLQLIKLVSIGGENQQHIVTQTHVRHILLKPDPSMLLHDSKKQVANLYQQLKAGKDFAFLAKRYSLDPVSAAMGGDLGWVSPGALVPEFEKAMDKLSVNEISQPIKSQFGWHLIQVLGRKQADDSSAFKKQQVRQFLQQRKFAEIVQNWQQHLRSNAYIHIIDKELA